MKIIKISEGPCTKFHYGKQQVYQYTFQFDKNVEADDDTSLIITKLIKRLTKNYDRLIYNINIKFLISSWRMSNGGAFVKVDNIDLADAYLQQTLYLSKNDTFNMFTIFARKDNGNFGGSDLHNDCLFSAIFKAHNFDKSNMPKTINKPWKLKKYLGLERNDLVSISKLELLEDIFKCSFTVSGDFIYISKDMKLKNISLHLYNEHYTLTSNKNRSKENQINYINIAENFIYTIKFDETISMYDGHKISKLSNDEFNTIYKTYTNIFVKIDLNEDLILKREEYIKKANYFKNHKFINFFKSSSVYKINHTNLMMLTKSIVQPEVILPIEGDILNKSFGGGLHYAKKGEYKDIHYYDINSMYAYYLSNGKFLFPIKQPNYKSYTTTEILNMRCFPFGLYNCNIIGKHPLFKNKNKCQWWSHYDLTRFKLLNLDIEMAEGINHLEYDRSKLINGSVFKKYIHDLYDERKTVSPEYEPVIKDFITSIWGELASKKRVVKRQKESFDAQNMFLENVILGEESQFTYIEADKIFKYDWARILFITSYCRLKITQIIIDNFDMNDILMVNTDGFISTTAGKNIKISSSIGDFKYKQYKKVTINHSNDVKLF